MLKQVFHDQRQAIYDNLSKLVESPRGAHAFVMDYTDRVDGKPKQGHELNVKHSTTFMLAPTEPTPPPSEAALEDDGTTPGPNGEPMFQM